MFFWQNNFYLKKYQSKETKFIIAIIMIKTTYCKECVYPINAVNLRIDADGICSSCKVHKANLKIGKILLKKREKQFKKILIEYKKK